MGKRSNYKDYPTDGNRLDPESAKQVLKQVAKLDQKRKRARVLSKKASHELWSYVYKYRNHFTLREFGEILDCTPSNVGHKISLYRTGKKPLEFDPTDMPKRGRPRNDDS